MPIQLSAGKIGALLVLALICGGIAGSVYRTVRKKDYWGLAGSLSMIPFAVFLISDLVLGGSAFNHASSDYALYEPGHYYLRSHSAYTEVSHGIFVYMRVMQVVGFVSFALFCICGCIRAAKRKRPPSRL